MDGNVLLEKRIEEVLKEIDAANLRRGLLPLDGPPGPRVGIAGRSLVNLCSNDYLSLAGDARLIRAGAEAAERFGAGAGASRLVTGNLPCHVELEEAVADFVGAEAALLFGSGYHANTGLIPALAGEGDLILSDEMNHASIIDGCRLSRAARLTFRHADANHLEDLLKAHRGDAALALVVTESVFSMDGDAPDLAALADLCARFEATLILDEAHALGVCGRGLAANRGITSQAGAIVGTFGKAFGSFGAFVAGSAYLRDLLLNRARTAVFSTALPPPAVGAALEALRIVRSEGDALTQRLRANVEKIAAAARNAGFSVPEPAGAIIPLVLGSEERALAAAQSLLDRGVLARAIRPPSVPPGTSRLRLTACVGHTNEDLDLVADALTGRDGF